MVDSAWIWEQYEIEDPQADEPHIVCRRCRKRVSYLTKHAVLRHNDPIRIEPMASSNLGRISAANAW